MNPAELEALLAGLLRLWQVQAALAVREDSGGLHATIESGTAAITVSHSIQAFGPVWQAETEGTRQRSYPSVIGLIRHLREALAPERGAARVVFANAGSAP